MHAIQRSVCVCDYVVELCTISVGLQHVQNIYKTFGVEGNTVTSSTQHSLHYQMVIILAWVTVFISRSVMAESMCQPVRYSCSRIVGRESFCLQAISKVSTAL